MYFTQTTGNKICQQSYKTEKITCWSPPTIASGPLGLFVASDNLLCMCTRSLSSISTNTDGEKGFTEFFANKVGSFNQTSHEFKEYKLPGVANFPAVTRAETRLNGQNYLW